MKPRNRLFVCKPVTPYRIPIGSIGVDDPDVPDDYLQEPRMSIGVVSDESLSNDLGLDVARKCTLPLSSGIMANFPLAFRSTG